MNARHGTGHPGRARRVTARRRRAVRSCCTLLVVASWLAACSDTPGSGTGSTNGTGMPTSPIPTSTSERTVEDLVTVPPSPTTDPGGTPDTPPEWRIESPLQLAADDWLVAVQRSGNEVRLAALDLATGFTRPLAGTSGRAAIDPNTVSILGLGDDGVIAGSAGPTTAGDRPTALLWRAPTGEVRSLDDHAAVAGPNDLDHVLVVHDPDGPFASAGSEYVGIWDPASGDVRALPDLGAPSMVPGAWFWLFDGDLVMARVSPGAALVGWTADVGAFPVAEPIGEIHRLQAIDGRSLLGCSDTPPTCGVYDIDARTWTPTDERLSSAVVLPGARTALVADLGPDPDGTPPAVHTWDLTATPEQVRSDEIRDALAIRIADVDDRGRLVGLLLPDGSDPLEPPSVPFLHDPAADGWIDLSRTVAAPTPAPLTLAAVLRTEDERPITGLTFSPDGSLLVARAHDGTMTVWDVATGSVRSELETYGRRPVQFTPDGALLLTVDLDGRAHVRDATTGSVVVTLPGVTDSGRDPTAELSPDGRLVVTAPGDGGAHVWETGSGTLLHRLPAVGPDDGSIVRFARFDDRGARVLAVRSGPDVVDVIEVWSVRSARLLRTVEPGEAVRDVHVVAGTDRLLVVSAGGVALWDASTGERVVELAVSTFRPSSALVTHGDRPRIVVADPLGTPLAACDPHTLELLAVDVSADDSTILLATSTDGRFLATSTVRSTGSQATERLELRDVATLAVVRRAQEGSAIRAVAFDPAESLVAVGLVDGRVLLWSW